MTSDQPDDTLFLNPDEIEQVMLAPEFHKLQYIANSMRIRVDATQGAIYFLDK